MENLTFAVIATIAFAVVLSAILVPSLMLPTYHYQYLVSDLTTGQFDQMVKRYSGFGIRLLQYDGSLTVDGSTMILIEVVTQGRHPDRGGNLLNSLRIGYLPIGFRGNK